MKTFVFCAIMLVCATCEAGSKTYYNRNGSVQFRSVQSGNQAKTYDSRGAFSGSYSTRGNSVTQIQRGFSSCKPNSTFGNRK